MGSRRLNALRADCRRRQCSQLPYDDERVEPFTAEELREQLRKASNGIEPPEFGPEFHLFHRDRA